ncbi:hypothetical protein GCM10014715_25660 [Streptomyces spiralis]|uniref:Uncharacterized protein n=1 Tax=Streptomyces spiralis TaxID=66376 RepID=A0A918ZV95_9ACTN|nr:hypothetical protein GCM10014715_25660 [Streptomyces spiralis]
MQAKEYDSLTTAAAAPRWPACPVISLMPAPRFRWAKGPIRPFLQWTPQSAPAQQACRVLEPIWTALAQGSPERQVSLCLPETALCPRMGRALMRDTPCSEWV